MPPGTRLQDLADRVKARLSKGSAPRRTPTGSPGATRSPDPTDDHAGTDGVEVVYEPERDGEPDPGEVVWSWVPYEEDPTQGKDRPVLILGHDGPLLAGVQLSSKDHSQRDDAREWVPVGRGAWDPEARPSYADASRLLRIEPRSVRREGAALDKNHFDEVVAHVARLHDWTGR